MANEVLIKSGTAKVWKASGGDFALSLASLANNAAREGVKGDLGATRARRWSVLVEIKMEVAPTAGNVIEIYWSSSPSSTPGTQNTGGAAGSDQAYKAGEEDEWKKQLAFIGALVVTADDETTFTQTMEFVFEPTHRYGMPVVVNKSGQALDDAFAHAITLTPIPDEIQ
jgi:hypothetical protein